MADEKQWTVDRAKEWAKEKGWYMGFNHVPAYAVNTTEFWQAETFDADAIRRELGWATDIGLKGSRVFLQYLVWDADPAAMRKQLDTYLSLSAERGIAVVPTLFDDCAFSGKEPKLGRQDAPVPGVHNSQWTPSPGPAIADDPARQVRLRAYVADIIGAFGKDKRVLFWDLYNEPGNSGRDARSLPLLNAAFDAARAAGPEQPVTAGVWRDDKDLNPVMINRSDILTFHHYGPVDTAVRAAAPLLETGRPVVCTEWMSRSLGSLYATHLPWFKERSIPCYHWGHVNGRTQTIFPWGSPPGAPEPHFWFHNIFRADGTPWNPAEIELIKQFSGRK